jgi:hypothetical protein
MSHLSGVSSEVRGKKQETELTERGKKKSYFFLSVLLG